MEQFLKSCKHSLTNISSYDIIHVIIGNESCDLDSAISSLTYGYLLYKEKQSSADSQEIVLSLLNVVKNDFPLKTEVTYLLSKHNIPFEYLIFKDEINLLHLQELGKLKLYLIDHHVLASEQYDLKSSVVEVLDHRPQDPNWNWTHIISKMELVGSCCSLVAREFFNRKPDVLEPVVGKLLHGTIILDTVNFSKSADRTKPIDIEMVEKIEMKCHIHEDRQQLFDELLAARIDISTLNSLQLLHRDLKMIKNVAFPGLPILVKDYIKRPDAMDALKNFSDIHNLPIIIPMGLVIVEKKVYRDIAVYSNRNCELASKCIDLLLKTKSPLLELQTVQTNIQGLHLFSQNNIKASRKQILPIIKTYMEENV